MYIQYHPFGQGNAREQINGIQLLEHSVPVKVMVKVKVNNMSWSWAVALALALGLVLTLCGTISTTTEVIYELILSKLVFSIYHVHS